jgi:cyclohexanone monooxygenase
MRREQNDDFHGLRAKTLASPIGMPFDVPQVSALEVSEEERQRRYDELWAIGGFRFMFTSYNDLVVDMAANDTVARYISTKIRDTVKDPAKAETLCQFHHPAGTKRPPIDTNYYETFNRDNVDLVNIRENPIREATADGLVLEDGDHYALDAIVFATGFDAVTGSLIKMNLHGRGGETLADKWENGPLAYLGLSSAGFPNLFMITGPGSPSILANFPVAIEQHVNWIADLLVHARDHDIEVIEPDAKAETDWAKMIAEEADKTLLPLANSWYMGANIPGKPRVFLAYPNGVNTYTELCDGVAARGYEGFEMHGREMAEAAA